MSSSTVHAAREARLIARAALKGALATNRRSAPRAQGQPYVSKVGVATDAGGAPLFLFSTLAAHTQDLLSDPRASILLEAPTAAANPLEGARCTLVGRVEKLTGGESDGARELYLGRHPGAAMYAGFGDFAMWRMSIEKVHYVGGFGRAKWVKGTEYLSNAADFANGRNRILENLNGAKRDDLCAVAAFVMGRSARGFKALSIDADGLALVGPKGAQARIDYLSPARDLRGWRARFQALCKKSVA